MKLDLKLNFHNLNIKAGDVIIMEDMSCMVVQLRESSKLLHLSYGVIVDDNCVTINDIIKEYGGYMLEVIKSEDVLLSRLK